MNIRLFIALNLSLQETKQSRRMLNKRDEMATLTLAMT